MKVHASAVPYRQHAGLRLRCRLDVYVPDAPGPYPVLLWFYGGGLTSGNRYLPPVLADKGIAVVTPDYRLHPYARCPAYIEDAAAAAAWTLRNAQTFGGDPNRVFIAGVSAGGFLASLVTLDKRWLAVYKLDPDRFAGLISISGQAITHFTIRAEYGIPGHRVVVDQFAPLFHVRSNAPPICLVTGDREHELMGRFEENAFFLRMLREAGHTRNELHEVPGVDHGGVEEAGLAILLEFIRRQGLVSED